MAKPGTHSGASSRRRTPWFVELALIIVVALAVSAFIRAFVAQAFFIPSGSMEQTLEEDDWIVVSKLSTNFGTIDRGEVVVFSDPGTWLPNVQTSSNLVRQALEFVGVAPDPAEGDLVKRVIGVGGDTVACCNPKGQVTVNGTAVVENYLYPGNSPEDAPQGCSGEFKTSVPAGYLFVMGDHRSVSEDSRCHDGIEKFVPEDNLQGRTVAVIWPIDHWSLVSIPSAFDDVS
ncbi:MAG: signal peptidase I [Actinomycetia bacterium]|nr:signal peptidase I [Actinomycetes bacterium]